MKKIMFNDRYRLTQAVIEGRKTMTRRIELSPNIGYIARHWNPIFNPQHCYFEDDRGMCQLINADTGKLLIPKYKVGDVVAVAQSYKSIADTHPDVDTFMAEIANAHGCDIENAQFLAGWKNKMFVKAKLMPHRIRITGVRCERLQDISYGDCLREGVQYIEENEKYYLERTDREEGFYFDSPREAFASLIDKVSGKGTWENNPWIIVYEFYLVK